MPVVLQIVGLATGRPSGADGMYVKAYTANGFGGRGDMLLTPDRAAAKRYRDAADALTDWKRVSSTHPIRRDGKPNRPLSAFSVNVVKVEA